MFDLSTHRIQFRPSPWPTVGAVVAIALTVYLGMWQQGRAEEKRLLQQRLDQRAQETPIRLTGRMRLGDDDEFRRVTVSGRYLPDEKFFIDNQSYGTTVGYHVIVPFAVGAAASNDTVLLVNRGFVARGGSYPHPPVVPVPAGEVEIHGMLKRPTAKFLELGDARPSADRVWQNITTERYAALSQRPVHPYVLLLAETTPPLTRVEERPDARVAKHVEYMMTWYSLALTVLCLWIALNISIVPIASRKPS